MWDQVLVVLHVTAVVVYLGGALLLHLSVRRALRLVPPGQAAALGARLGRDFTWVSWFSLALWGVTGYWLLARGGRADPTAFSSLFIEPAFLEFAPGRALLAMVLAWYLLVANALVITFVLRPRVGRRLGPDASAQASADLTRSISTAATWIDVLAFVNLVITAAGFVVGKLYF